MKKHLLLIAISLICNYYVFAAQYEITGVCKLENQTKCDSILISLNRSIPSPLNYIFYTDSIGNYSFTVEEGIYNIEYSKNGYIQEVFSDIQVYSNLTRDIIILGQIGLNGNINGVLTKGTYKVGASISISFGDTLIIDPDVTLQFEENAELNIQGLLIAQGTNFDSVIFTEYTKGKGWGGIKFKDGSNSNSILSYCVVERSINSGISIINSSPTIQKTIIRYNSAIESDQNIIAAGIVLNNSGSQINNVLVYKNELIPNQPTSYFHGAAGIGCYNGSPTIQNSKIYDNLSDIWSGLSAGGLNCIGNCQLTISNSLIYGNSGHYGGGICCQSDGLIARNLTITQNEATMGGGIFVSVSDPKIYNSIIAYNFCNSYGRLLAFSGSSGNQPHPTFQNCFFSVKPDSSIGLPDFYSDVDLSQNINHFLDMVTINENEVDCDPYYNIIGFPLFVDSLTNFKLNEQSPCIDAGNNDFVIGTYDLDGNKRIANGNFLLQSFVDIGAYEFNTGEFLLSGNHYCSNDSLEYFINFNEEFESGNQFIVKLSDTSFSFENSSILATFDTIYPVHLFIEIPDTIIYGKKYLVQTISTSPQMTSKVDTIVQYQTPISNFAIDTNNIFTTDTILISYEGVPLSQTIFDWNFDNGNILTGENAGPYEISWANAGIKNISLIVQENGCSSESNLKFNVNQKTISEINNDISFNNIEIYPNPALNKLFIKSQINNRNIEVSIISNDGKLLITKQTNLALTEIDISNLNNGIYILRIKKDNKIINKKFIKK